jgi:hypothetical protein
MGLRGHKKFVLANWPGRKTSITLEFTFCNQTFASGSMTSTYVKPIEPDSDCGARGKFAG